MLPQKQNKKPNHGNIPYGQRTDTKKEKRHEHVFLN